MDVKKAVIPSDGFGMRFLPANFNCIPTKYPENKKQVFSKQPLSPFPGTSVHEIGDQPTNRCY
jgi:hypothetical protein